MADRRALRALLGLVVLAAALRFWRIGEQSFWFDETFTPLVVDRGFFGMLDKVVETESTPHLYYVLAWLWSRVFGEGEAGLRSLSALLGVATVPVAYAAARELFDPRAALVGTGLVAVNPWLVWYSQEARAYALLVLLATAALLFFLRALRTGERRDLALWAAAAAAALLTHYFAAFLLAPQAIWLLWRTPQARAAVGAVAAVGAALAPLALHQRGQGHTAFISELPLDERFLSLPKKFVTGELGTPTAGLGPVAGALALAGVALLWRHGAGRERPGALFLAALAAVALLVPLVLAVAGLDYLFPRNAIAVFVPLALGLGAGFGAARAGTAGLALAAGLAATAIAVTIQVGLNEDLQRDDLRSLAKALGPATGDRAWVVNPPIQWRGIEHYDGRTRKFPDRVLPVYEVDAILIGRDGIERQPQPPGQAFLEVERLSDPSWELVRYRATPPGPVGPPFAEASRLAEEAPSIRLQRRR